MMIRRYVLYENVPKASAILQFALKCLLYLGSTDDLNNWYRVTIRHYEIPWLGSAAHFGITHVMHLFVTANDPCIEVMHLVQY